VQESHSSSLQQPGPQPHSSQKKCVVMVREVSRFYKKSSEQVTALNKVSFSLQKGDRVVVTGTSGSGKSTLLHMIGTLDRPSSGQIMVWGSDVTTMSDQMLSVFRNSTVGFVFQMNNLLPEFSALENVMMPALIAGIAQRGAKKRAAKLLDAVELSHRQTHKPAELSGGEQQRVAIARALMMNPEILLADEPTGNLDQETSYHIQALLQEICNEHNTTMLLVTHDTELAQCFDKHLVMADGKVVDAKGVQC